MARVDCKHNIAWVIMAPVGVNMVECKVHSVYRKECTSSEIMKFDPRIIQEWIYQKTRLKCFNFNVGFEDLSTEVKEYNKKHGKKIPVAVEAKWDARLKNTLKECEETRKSWVEAPHDHNDVRTKYSLGNDQRESQQVKITLG